MGQEHRDFTTYCLPSLLQPNNLPWLVRNGYPVALDFYTIKPSNETLVDITQSIVRDLAAYSADAEVSTTIHATDISQSIAKIRIGFFQTSVRKSIETRSPVIFIMADMYVGDGSLRNIVTYAQKPDETPVSNARLTDICLESLRRDIQASQGDDDSNASYFTGSTIRTLGGDDLCAYNAHELPPMLFSFDGEDHAFFDRFQFNFAIFNYVWPSMMMARHRWRVMASSDLFCMAELGKSNPHGLPPEPAGMRFNDEYEQEHLHGRIHQTMVMALRRER